jgi:hypothetical protein
VLGTTVQYRLQKWGLSRYRIFADDGRRLAAEQEAGVTVTPAPVEKDAA